MIPWYLDGMAAFLHPANGARGVVIVSSWGFEDLCAHRALATLAQDISQAGCPVLRIDLPGTGDSAGDATGGDVVDRWLRGIQRALEWMSAYGNVKDVSLVGLRLGALLAAQLARRVDLESLTLLAPPPSGKRYLREMRVLARVVDRAQEKTLSTELQLAGFQLVEPARTAISEIELGDLSRSRRLIIVDAPGESTAALADESRTERHVFEGYAQMMCDPTAGSVPRALFQKLALRVAQGATVAGPEFTPPALPVHLKDHDEEAVCFRHRTGVLNRGSAGGPAIILLNAGGVRRIGWARIWVDAARALSRQGVTTLRFDLPYLDALEPDQRDHVAACYREDAQAAISEAVDELVFRGFTEIAVAGLCSGAYHALQTALKDHRITRVILINQLCYVWSSANALPLSAWAQQKASDVQRRSVAVDDEQRAWLRLLNQFAVRALSIAKALGKAAYRRLRRSSGNAASTTAIGWFNDLAQRGIRVDVVLSSLDASISVFDDHFGAQGEAIQAPQLHVHVIEGADHLLTSEEARRELIDILGAPSPLPLAEAA